MNSNETKYFYVVDVAGVRSMFGENLPPIKEHALAFVATPSRARGILFVNGYNLDSEANIFKDDKQRFTTEVFETTDGTDSMEDDIPDRLAILYKHHPYANTPHATDPLDSLRFSELHIHRFINPKHGAGKVRRRNQSRNTRKTRKTRRTRKTRKTQRN